MSVLELQTGSQYWRRLALIWGMFAVIGFAIAAVAKQPLLGFTGLFLMVAPAYMLWSRRNSWVARMDGDGVGMISGKRFGWAEFEKVFEIKARGGHSHYEIVFKGGRARVFDRMLSNKNEVVSVVAALGRGENPFAPASLKQDC